MITKNQSGAVNDDLKIPSSIFFTNVIAAIRTRAIRILKTIDFPDHEKFKL